jgi:hypothetical protein
LLDDSSEYDSVESGSASAGSEIEQAEDEYEPAE